MALISEFFVLNLPLPHPCMILKLIFTSTLKDTDTEKKIQIWDISRRNRNITCPCTSAVAAAYHFMHLRECLEKRPSHNLFMILKTDMLLEKIRVIYVYEMLKIAVRWMKDHKLSVWSNVHLHKLKGRFCLIVFIAITLRHINL